MPKGSWRLPQRSRRPRIGHQRLLVRRRRRQKLLKVWTVQVSEFVLMSRKHHLSLGIINKCLVTEWKIVWQPLGSFRWRNPWVGAEKKSNHWRRRDFSKIQVLIEIFKAFTSSQNSSKMKPQDWNKPQQRSKRLRLVLKLSNFWSELSGP